MARKELEYIRTDRNGTKYFYNENCPRCGGEGYSAEWAGVCDNICYLCKGTGRTKRRIVKEYTPEHAAAMREKKLQRLRDKKEAAKAAALEAGIPASVLRKYGFNTNGTGFVYTGNTYEIRTELKAGGAKFSYALHWVSPQPIGEYPCIEIQAAEVFDLWVLGNNKDVWCEWDLQNQKCDAIREKHGIN